MNEQNATFWNFFSLKEYEWYCFFAEFSDDFAKQNNYPLPEFTLHLLLHTPLIFCWNAKYYCNITVQGRVFGICIPLDAINYEKTTFAPFKIALCYANYFKYDEVAPLIYNMWSQAVSNGNLTVDLARFYEVFVQSTTESDFITILTASPFVTQLQLRSLRALSSFTNSFRKNDILEDFMFNSLTLNSKEQDSLFLKGFELFNIQPVRSCKKPTFLFECNGSKWRGINCFSKIHFKDGNTVLIKCFDKLKIIGFLLAYVASEETWILKLLPNQILATLLGIPSYNEKKEKRQRK